ncbi:MAG TPA: hypothetical protein VGY54_16470 [Polyangiaceae bacterium]|jgi:hypothetical protein|nr:hypothetical protein [Polyangiaceae bacterium]
MSMIRSDFRGVEVFESGGETFATGVYKFRVEDAVPGMSQTGNPIARVRSQCIGALGDGDPQRFVGRRVTRSYPTTGDGVFRWKRLLMSIGYRPEDLDDDIDIDPAQDVVSREFWAFLKTVDRNDGSGQTNDVVEHFGELSAQDEAQFIARGSTEPRPSNAGSDGVPGPVPPQPAENAFGASPTLLATPYSPPTPSAPQPVGAPFRQIPTPAGASPVPPAGPVYVAPGIGALPAPAWPAGLNAASPTRPGKRLGKR